jgi:HAD superfamily phosphatase (TIGR01668 family)
MNNYIPKIYKKSILDIDYKELKRKNIKCLMFDLDNTLLEIHESIPKEDICNLIKKIKKDFKIIIISNNTSKKRLSKAANELGVDYIKFALKPSSKAFRKVQKDFGFKKSEMCIIGDQLITDIKGGNKYDVLTILVDPLSEEELKVTGINRFFEGRILKKLSKNKRLKRGEYYG